MTKLFSPPKMPAPEPLPAPPNDDAAKAAESAAAEEERRKRGNTGRAANIFAGELEDTNNARKTLG